jgi:hypothetical protein
LIIVVSGTFLPMELIGREQEWFQLGVLDVESGEMHFYPDFGLPRETKVINAVSGRVMVRNVGGHTVLFIPGMAGEGRLITRALFRVDLNTGGQIVMRQGSPSTLGWLVDADGELVAEEDYDQSQQQWWIMARRDGHLREVVSGHEAIDIPQLLGFGPDPGKLLVQTLENGNRGWRQLCKPTFPTGYVTW